MNVSRVAATRKHAGCEEESSRVIAPPHPTLLFACRTARPQRDIKSEGNWQEQQKKEWDEVLVERKSQNTTPGKRWWWWWGSCVGVCIVAAVVVGRINISATWPLKPLPMTADIMKRYGSREGERNEKDKKRTVK